MNNEPTDSPKLGIIHIHVPRCAGTALASALAGATDGPISIISGPSTYRVATAVSRRADDATIEYDDVYAIRQEFLLYSLFGGARFVSGHCLYSPLVSELFQSTHFHITVLRDPVERWLSHYYYDRFKTHSTHRRITCDMEAFVGTPRARHWGSLYVRYLGGAREDHCYWSEEAVTRAKEHLNHFQLIGRVECMNEFLVELGSLLGTRVQIEALNAGPIAPSQRIVSAALLDRIRLLCAPDTEIYNEVTNRWPPIGSFVSQVKDESPSVKD